MKIIPIYIESSYCLLTSILLIRSMICIVSLGKYVHKTLCRLSTNIYKIENNFPIFVKFHLCPGGGIGRRAGLKHQ